MSAQDQGLQGGQGPAADGAGALAGLLHDARQVGQRLEDPLGHGRLGAGGDADLLAVTVHESAQRRGDVGVAGGNRGVDGLLGVGGLVVGRDTDPAHPEGEVARSAEEGHGLLHEGRVGGDGVVQAAHELGVGLGGRPVDAQGRGDAPQAGVVLGARRRQGPQDADAALDHDPGGAHAGEQGDLGVVLLGGHGHAVGEPVAGRAGALGGLGGLGVTRRRRLPCYLCCFCRLGHLDDLLGRGHADAAAGGLPLQTQTADLGQKLGQVGRHLLGQGVLPVNGVLDLGVAKARPRAHEGPLDAGGDDLTALVKVDGPQAGRALGVLKQGGGAVGEDLGVQGRGGIGGVDGLAAATQLSVQGAAGGDEGGQGGDGVVDSVGGRRLGGVPGPPGGRAGLVSMVRLCGQALQEHRLVEVHGAGRVDGDQFQVSGVAGAVGQKTGGAVLGPGAGSGLRLGEGLGRESGRHLVVRAQRVQGPGDLGGRGGVGTQARATHGMNLPARAFSAVTNGRMGRNRPNLSRAATFGTECAPQTTSQNALTLVRTLRPDACSDSVR